MSCFGICRWYCFYRVVVVTQSVPFGPMLSENGLLPVMTCPHAGGSDTHGLNPATKNFPYYLQYCKVHSTGTCIATTE